MQRPGDALHETLVQWICLIRLFVLLLYFYSIASKQCLLDSSFDCHLDQDKQINSSENNVRIIRMRK